MKQFTLFSVLIIFVLKSFSQSICDGMQTIPIQTFFICDNSPWILVFEDNFNGNTLDLSKWEIQGWGQGALYGNGSTQEYNTLDNAVVSNNTLKIITKKETVQRRAISYKPDNEILEDGIQNLRTYNYTSSNIWTKPKFSYGKFEARIKIPKGKGFWPAFWTFGGNPWNEIDVFEFWNENDIWGNYDASKLSTIHHMTAHYDYDNDGNTNMCSTHYNGIDFSQDFHIFTVTWEKNKMEWFVDGILKRTDYRYYTILGQTTGCTIEAMHQYILNEIYPKDPMSIILSLGIQSGTNSPDNSTIFPSQMEVDWVRYYQRTTDFCSQNPNKINGSEYICDSNIPYLYQFSGSNSCCINLWSCSSNLEILENTPSSVTIRAKNSTISEGGWIKASFTASAPCSQNEVVKNIWIGKPIITLNSIYNLQDMGYSNYYKMLPASGNYPFGGSLSVNSSGGDNNDAWSFYAYIPKKNIAYWAASANTVDVGAKTNNAGEVLKYSASNTCGTANALYTFFTGNLTPPPHPLIITPNPATTQAEISIPVNPANADGKTATTIQNSYTVSVINSYGLSVYSATGTAEKITIPASSLQNGIYIVRVTDGATVFQGNLVVNH